MGWESIEGHEAQLRQFRQAVQGRRLASSFLLVGPEGIGKRGFALELARSLLCETRPESALDACGQCPSCLQVAADSHPDLEQISKPADRTWIPVELLIGDRDHRMQEGLIHRLGMKPYRGGRKIAIIDDADFLRAEAANCLLKTLEEPPPRSVILLIGTSEQRQLPTIRSRCQIVRFQPLAVETVARLLREQSEITDDATVRTLAALAGGSIQRARQLADSEIGQLRESFLQDLSRPDWDSVALAKSVAQAVDDAGSDAPSRRDRLHQLMSFAVDFYRQLMRTLVGSEPEGDDLLKRLASSAADRVADPQRAALCLQRCLDGQGQVRANAHPHTLVDCWIDDLSSIERGEAYLPP